MEDSAQRSVTYCIVPAPLAGELHDVLRSHFKRKRDIEVVVERRGGDRRLNGRRRGADASAEAEEERRRVRVAQGRRAGERRAMEDVVEPPPLPDKALPYADQLRFVQRLEPSGERSEDQDSVRLVARLQGGEQDAFAVLYRRYFDRVYSYLRFMLAEGRAAETATQDAFAATYNALFDYTQSAGRSFRTWLFRYVNETAARALAEQVGAPPVDIAKLARRRRAAEADQSLVELELNALSDQELVAQLAKLPAPQRRVVLLRYMLALSPRDIASLLGQPAEEIRALHYTAMSTLGEMLRQRAKRKRAGAGSRGPAGIA